MDDYAIPDIDEGIPLPSRATEAMPLLSPREEMEMRARTVQLLAEINQIPLIPSEVDKAQAVELVRQVSTNPNFKPDYEKYPNEVMAHLSELIAQSSFEIVEDLSNLRHYIVNKLVYEIEYAKTSKDRISALAKLGEVDGVDAFKRRSEMTVKVLSIEEVEKKLLNILDNIEYSVVDKMPPALEESMQDAV